MKKIYDMHTHIYPEAIAEKAGIALGKFYNFDVECKGTYKDLEEKAESFENYGYKTEGFLIFSVATNGRQVEKVNDAAAEKVRLSREHGYDTVGFCGMHYDYPDFMKEIERCRNELSLRGVKIHPDIQRFDIDSKEMYEIAEIIEGRMPLCLHMGDPREEYRYSEPKKLSRLLDRFPKLVAIATHMGGYGAWEEARDIFTAEKISITIFQAPSGL